jgi:hypothetical protein
MAAIAESAAAWPSPYDALAPGPPGTAPASYDANDAFVASAVAFAPPPQAAKQHS